MSKKQDRQGVRSLNALEQKYLFDKTFAEILERSARISAEEAEKAAGELDKAIKSELSLRIRYDEGGKIVSAINACADNITIKGNRLSIESNNFTLTQDGTATMKKGVFDECTIKETCSIQGKLTGNTISTFTSKSGASGKIAFWEYRTGDDGAEFVSPRYEIEAGNGADLAGVRIGQFDMFSVTLYTSASSFSLFPAMAVTAVPIYASNFITIDGLDVSDEIQKLKTRIAELGGS